MQVYGLSTISLKYWPRAIIGLHPFVIHFLYKAYSQYFSEYRHILDDTSAYSIYYFYIDVTICLILILLYFVGDIYNIWEMFLLPVVFVGTVWLLKVLFQNACGVVIIQIVIVFRLWACHEERSPNVKSTIQYRHALRKK